MRLLDEHIEGFRESALEEFADAAPWELTRNATQVVARLLAGLDDSYAVRGDVAVHITARCEPGSILKGPAIIGPQCLIAAGAYVRDGCWLEADCVLGPGSEMKSSFAFGAAKLAHFNFVGDSILGHRVNLEAGSIIANYRNELAEPTISFWHAGSLIETGTAKFGALVGDHSRVGANAVIAPGAILAPSTVVGRLSLVDRSVRSG